MACHAVLVETPERECRARNRARPEAVPSSLITSQLRAMTATITAIEDEAFDAVHRASDEAVVVVPH